MGAIDWLLLRSRSVELRASCSASDTVARLREAFPSHEPMVLALKPFAPPTNVGTFEGDNVRLRIIDMQGRNWLRPELHAHVRAVEGGCAIEGTIRYDPSTKALFVLLFCAISALAAGMAWSISSSLWTTAIVTPAIMLAFQTMVAVFQISEVSDLLHEVTTAIKPQRRPSAGT